MTDDTKRREFEALTDEQIVAIRDEHLPNQGESFDCIAFARAVLAAYDARTADARDADRLDWIEKHWLYRDHRGDLSFSYNDLWSLEAQTLRDGIDAEIAQFADQHSSGDAT